MENVAREKTFIGVFHELFPGLGYLTPFGSGFDFVAYQGSEVVTGLTTCCPGNESDAGQCKP